jgi:signal transduction histidine kinase
MGSKLKRMLYDFLNANRDLLVQHCNRLVANRTSQEVAREDSVHGISIFLSQLIKTLKTEVAFDDAKSRDISGTGDGAPGTSEIGATAALHGSELLKQGVPVDQVVHDYGDICQAITNLANKQAVLITVDEFRTLNRCLDNAIAAAVTEHQYQFGQNLQRRTVTELNEQLAILAHELRNQVNTASLALVALKSGYVGLEGATGTALNRALLSLRRLIDRSLADVRVAGGLPPRCQEVWLSEFISEISSSASLEATSKNCLLNVSAVDASLAVNADCEMLYSAVGSLLTNAFKFTKSGSAVSLCAYASSDRILIEVADRCGGLPPGGAEQLFKPFHEAAEDCSGLGLGLAACRRGVEANGGVLNGRDIPGHGCVFTIDLPRGSVS